jgi:hypothetical protein
LAENPLNLSNSEGSPSGNENAPVKKSQTTLETISAESVQLNQSTVHSIQAENVSMEDSAAQHIQAQTMNVTGSGIAVAQATTLNISKGAALIASAGQAEIQGNVGLMIGQTVQLKDHRTGLVITREATGDHIQAVLFLAGQSHAPVETIADQRSVALFGLTFGIAMGLVVSLFRFFKTR